MQGRIESGHQYGHTTHIYQPKDSLLVVCQSDQGPVQLVSEL